MNHSLGFSRQVRFLAVVVCFWSSVLIGIPLADSLDVRTQEDDELARFTALRSLLIGREKYPLFDVGDAFPDSIVSIEGNIVSLKKLLGQQQALLLAFVFDSCHDCEQLKADWPSILERARGENMEGFLVQNIDSLGIAAKDSATQKPKEGLQADFRMLRRKWNVHFIPTIVSVDSEGKIVHISFGYEGRIENLHFISSAKRNPLEKTNREEVKKK